MSAKKPGQIITFYSYKGGTGRSMALANVAWILASQGKRVLMVDWDLEAPGLHRYFHPFLQDKNLVSSEGVIDLMMKFEEAAVAPYTHSKEPQAGRDSSDWYLPFAEISKSVIPLAWPFKNGILDLLPAGKQGLTYAARVNAFNWSSFYNRLGGGVFLEAVKKNMREHYDYILIDSRTGVSDTAGVCTVQMPDLLVVCFTYNTQSIEGTASIAGSVRSQRAKGDTLDEGRSSFRVFPVPMRVDRVEKERLDQARNFAQDAFAGFIDHLSKAKQDEYWGEIDVPYVPFYSYQEVLATIGEEPGVRDSILTSFERLTDFLTNGEVSRQEPLPKKERQDVKQLFLRGGRPRSVKVILSNNPELQRLCDELVTRQSSWSESKKSDEYLLDSERIKRLQGNIELLIAMLQDRAFREYWDASKSKIQQRAIRRFAGMHIVAFVIFASLLLAGIIISPNLQAIHAPLAVAAGLLGATLSSLKDLYVKTDHGGAESGLRSGSFWTGLMTGGSFGALVATLFTFDLIRIPVEDRTTTLPVTFILFAFLGGYASTQLVPFRRIMTVPTPRDKGGHQL